MPKDKPINSDSEGLRPLPKPIKLDLPAERPKQQRRLHEQDAPDYIPEDFHKNFAPEPERPKPGKNKSDQKRSSGKGYFDSVQKAYGQRRPRRPKSPPKQKPQPRRHAPSSPRLGRGDRLYNPPQIKKPFFSPKVKRVLSFWSLGVIAILFIVLILMSMLRHNAWAVYVDGRFVGYMPINREVEMYTVHSDAVSHLSVSHVADVRVNEETIVRTARARRGEIMPATAMTVAVAQQFTYQIMAVAVYLDGEQIAILRNRYEVEHVEREIQRVYFDPTESNIVASFEEEWEARPTLVDIEDLDTQSNIIQMLSRPVSDIYRHTIRPSDSQSALALEFSTTIESIGYLNNIGIDAILDIGDTLLIEITRPRLTVRTVGQVTFLEDIPMYVRTIDNPNWHVSEVYVREPGRNGQQEVIKEITRINGTQVGEPEIISEREITSPQDRVEEVGTSTTIIDVR